MYIAATPDLDNNLGLFKVALVAIVKGQQVPESLKEHVISVLTQAVEVLQDPQNIPASVVPEALELAVQISKFGELQRSLEDNFAAYTNSPEKAKELLEKVDGKFAYAS